MKKLTFILFALILVLCGCNPKLGFDNKTYQDLKVESQIHNNFFIYTIEHKRSYTPYNTKIRISKTKDVFFNELKENQYFVEQYDQDTLLFFKNNDGDSSYFTVVYQGEYDSLHIYNFTNADIQITDNGIGGETDFPYYILAEKYNLETGDNETTCGFDYIADFYDRLPDVTIESNENYIIINLYNNKEKQDKNLRIAKAGEYTINISVIDAAGE